VQPTTPPWRVLETPSEEPAGTARGEAAKPEPVLGRPPLAAVLAVGAAGLLLLAAVVLVTQADHGSVEIRTASAAERSASAPDSTTPMLVVEVAGAVTRPGVHSLPPGSRVGDAIAAAGGYSPRVDAAAADRLLNLAAPVRDGDQVRVPSRDDPDPAATRASDSTGSSGTSRLLNLNRATAAELEALPGIGPATAAKIVASRTDQPFGTVEDLLARKLVSGKVLEAIRPLVSTG
jgi:competence protein ComEA